MNPYEIVNGPRRRASYMRGTPTYQTARPYRVARRVYLNPGFDYDRRVVARPVGRRGRRVLRSAGFDESGLVMTHELSPELDTRVGDVEAQLKKLLIGGIIGLLSGVAMGWLISNALSNRQITRRE